MYWDGIIEALVEDDWDFMEYVDGYLTYEAYATRVLSRSITQTVGDVQDRIGCYWESRVF